MRVFRSPQRQRIDEAVSGLQSNYAREVKVVNRWLDESRFEISERSTSSVIRNVRAVENGGLAESRAHAREAGSFLEDAWASLRRGELRQGAMEVLGAAANALASLLRL